MRGGRALVLGLLVAGTASVGAERARASERPRFGGEMTLVGEHDVPASLQPGELYTPIGRTIARALYDTLVRADDEGTVRPHLAREVQSSRGGREWRFALRSGVSFHDGRQLTADDVVASLLAWAGRAGRGGCLGSAGEDDTAVRVLAEDGLAVRVLLDEPCPRLDVELADPSASIVAPAVAASHDAADGAARGATAIGTGPFRLTGRTGAGGLRLEAHGTHFRGRPFLDAVTVLGGLDRAARRRALRIGTAEAALGTRVDADGTVRWTPGGTSTVFLVASPTRVPGLVRGALSEAIDRRLVADVILGGNADRADQPVPAGRMPYGPLHAPIVAPPSGASVPPSDGALTLTVASEDRPLDLVAQRIQADLEAAGVSVGFERVGAEAVARGLADDALTLALVERGLPDGPPTAWFGAFLERLEPSPGDRARELARSASRAEDVGVALKGLYLAERSVVREAVWIPIVHRALGASHVDVVHVERVEADGSLELATVWSRPR